MLQLRWLRCESWAYFKRLARHVECCVISCWFWVSNVLQTHVESLSDDSTDSTMRHCLISAKHRSAGRCILCACFRKGGCETSPDQWQCEMWRVHGEAGLLWLKKMYMVLDGQFLLVTGRIVQLGVANAFGDFKHTAQSWYCFMKRKVK